MLVFKLELERVTFANKLAGIGAEAFDQPEKVPLNRPLKSVTNGSFNPSKICSGISTSGAFGMLLKVSLKSSVALVADEKSSGSNLSGIVTDV